MKMNDNLIKQEEFFLKLLNKILDNADKQQIVLRVLGALAFRIHCPKFKHIAYALNRNLSDLDLAAYGKDADRISKLFTNLGYEEVLTVRLSSKGLRRKFHDKRSGVHLDVFFDVLQMCHDINLKNRLEIDYPTIPLTDLFLEKMQIVNLDLKDIIDTLILLREHDIGNGEKEIINVKYLASLCANDWGLWKTVTTNLDKTKNFALQIDILQGEDKTDITRKIDGILKAIEKEPKSALWRMRAKIGERKKWYREVENP